MAERQGGLGLFGAVGLCFPERSIPRPLTEHCDALSAVYKGRIRPRTVPPPSAQEHGSLISALRRWICEKGPVHTPFTPLSLYVTSQTLEQHPFIHACIPPAHPPVHPPASPLSVLISMLIHAISPRKDVGLGGWEAVNPVGVDEGRGVGGGGGGGGGGRGGGGGHGVTSGPGDRPGDRHTASPRPCC